MHRCILITTFSGTPGRTKQIGIATRPCSFVEWKTFALWVSDVVAEGSVDVPCLELIGLLFPGRFAKFEEALRPSGLLAPLLNRFACLACQAMIEDAAGRAMLTNSLWQVPGLSNVANLAAGGIEKIDGDCFCDGHTLLLPLQGLMTQEVEAGAAGSGVPSRGRRVTVWGAAWPGAPMVAEHSESAAGCKQSPREPCPAGPQDTSASLPPPARRQLRRQRPPGCRGRAFARLHSRCSGSCVRWRRQRRRPRTVAGLARAGAYGLVCAWLSGGACAWRSGGVYGLECAWPSGEACGLLWGAAWPGALVAAKKRGPAADCGQRPREPGLAGPHDTSAPSLPPTRRQCCRQRTPGCRGRIVAKPRSCGAGSCARRHRRRRPPRTVAGLTKAGVCGLARVWRPGGACGSCASGGVRV